MCGIAMCMAESGLSCIPAVVQGAMLLNLPFGPTTAVMAPEGKGPQVVRSRKHLNPAHACWRILLPQAAVSDNSAGCRSPLPAPDTLILRRHGTAGAHVCGSMSGTSTSSLGDCGSEVVAAAAGCARLAICMLLCSRNQMAITLVAHVCPGST